MRTLTLSTLSIALLFLAGCGQDGVPVVRVTGQIFYEGNAVDAANVTFIPVESDGRIASGVTNADGEFMLATQGAERSGALPGNYRIKVSKHIQVDAQGNLIVQSNDPPPSFQDPNAPPPVRPINKPVLPAKYDNAETSGFTAEITRRGQNHFVFELMP